jgi:tRNA(Ile)-lysidine synthase
LERTALRTGSGFVATAHHADDNAETLLHRICRGTGLRGLAGMAEVRAIQPGSRVQLVRPLLPIRRATIDALCQARNIEYRIDSSNALLDFTRNRLRYSIIPTLREAINPNVTEALLRIAEQVRWLGAYVDDAATRAFDSLLVNESPRHIVLNTTALLSKQRLIQAEVVRRAITQIAGREQDLNFAHIEQVLKLAEDLESGKEVHVPGPVVVRKLYERLEFRPLGDSGPLPAMETLSVQLPGRTSLAPLGLELESELMELRSDESEHMRLKTNPFEEWMDLDRLRPPLFVRSRREGDRFRPLGAPGAKTISDFLSDEKVDPLLRSRVGLLCDQEGPVWVMPLRIEDRVKIRPTTTRAVRFVLTAAGPYVPDGS